MTSVWRHLWPKCDTLDFKILTQFIKWLGERVLQVWWLYLHWFRRYRKKTRGARNCPPVGRGLIGPSSETALSKKHREETWQDAKRCACSDDHSRAHQRSAAINKAVDWGSEMLLHLPFFMDLAPSGFNLFPNIKKHSRVASSRIAKRWS